MDNKEKDNYRKLQRSQMQRFQKLIFKRILDFIGVSCILFCIFAINDILPQYDCNYCIGIGLATLLGSAIGGITTGLSSAVSGKMNRRSLRYNKEQAELNRQFQSEEAEKARQWQENIYNQYESPQSMVRQYLDAGLNPALMYGSAGSGSMPSTSVPSGSMASAPGMQMPDFSGLLSIAESMLNLSRTEAEIENIKSATVRTEQETSNLKTNQELMDADIYLKHITADNVLLQTEINRSELRRIESQIRNIDIDSLVKSASIDKIRSEIDLNESQMQLITSQIGLNEKQLEEIEARIDNLLADTKNKEVQAALNFAKIVTEQAIQSLTEEKAHNASVERIGINRDNFLKLIDIDQATVTGTSRSNVVMDAAYGIYFSIASKIIGRRFYDSTVESNDYKNK